MAVSPLPAMPPAVSKSKAFGKEIHPEILAVRKNTVISHETRAKNKNEGDAEPIRPITDSERPKYIKDKKLGEGTYATVHLGHLASSPTTLVAIKKIKIIPTYHDGLTMDAIREIKHLQELQHPNIITLHSVFSSRLQNLNLVLEYLPNGDLEQLIRSPQTISYGAADVKAWMGMLACAVAFCHSHFILHRDIKPNNLLIAANGEIKLADFGLARNFSDPYLPMTHQVITRWYRPPELLYGARHYGGAVDVWSMGAVFAELILRVPFLAGNTDMHQLELIGRAIGTPTEETWPGVSSLPDYVQLHKDRPTMQSKEHFTALFGSSGPVGVELLMHMLSLDPRKRPTARQMLQHRWWTIEPRPTRKEDLPRKTAGAMAKMGHDLARRAGDLDDKDQGRGAKVARKLDFTSQNET